MASGEYSPLFIGLAMTPNEIFNKNKKQCAIEHAILNSYIQGQKADLVIIDDIIPNTIAPCQSTVPSISGHYNWLMQSMQKEEGKNPMYDKMKSNTAAVIMTSEASVEATQRDFLSARVNQVRKDLESKLREQFNLDVVDGPRTAVDLIKRIKDDDYRLDEKVLTEYASEIERGYYNSFFGIKWGKIEPDHKGYEVARKALKDEAQAVIDTVTLGSIEEGRKALKDFQSWSYKAKK